MRQGCLSCQACTAGQRSVFAPGCANIPGAIAGRHLRLPDTFRLLQQQQQAGLLVSAKAHCEMAAV